MPLWPGLVAVHASRANPERALLGASFSMGTVGSTDPDAIRAWWEREPDAGLAVVTGSRSRLMAIDVDQHGDVDGEWWWHRLETEWAERKLWLPATHVEGTRRDGFHIELAVPDGVRVPTGELLPGVEVLGEGHWMAVAPTTGYAVVRDGPHAEAPDWLLAFVADAAAQGGNGSGSRGRVHEEVMAAGGVPWIGVRRHFWNDRAFRLRKGGHGREAILADLRPRWELTDQVPNDPQPWEFVEAVVDRVVREVEPEDPVDPAAVSGLLRGLAAAPATAGDTEFDRALRWEDARQRARAFLREREAAAAFVEPPSSRTLADELATEDGPVEWTVQHLHERGMNTTVVASYKTGKTVLLGNLLRALADGSPFLGSLDVRPPDGRVAFLNYEMGERQFRRWLRSFGIQSLDRGCVLNLRGYTLDPTSEHHRRWLVRWLVERDVRALILDPFTRAYRGDENDNAQAKAWTDALDLLKREAGVDDAFVSVHRGRDKEEERARGATRLDDWPDALWLLTRDDHGLRYLSAQGRDVEFPESVLTFDGERKSLALSGLGSGRREVAREAAVRDAVEAARAAGPQTTTTAVKDGMRQTRHGEDQVAALSEAVRRGLIAREPGVGRAVLHTVTEDGERWLQA